MFGEGKYEYNFVFSGQKMSWINVFLDTCMSRREGREEVTVVVDQDTRWYR